MAAVNIKECIYSVSLRLRFGQGNGLCPTYKGHPPKGHCARFLCAYISEQMSAHK